MLQRTATRLYYCAPLLVRLALEDGEHGETAASKGSSSILAPSRFALAAVSSALVTET